jgi:IrrE N-terminal-like domain
VKIFHEAHGLDRFPIKIALIATEYSRNVFPDAPITKVEGLDLSAKFEGMLLPHPNRNGEWGIFYNNSIASKGRINFTLGHELGHYLLHRHLSPESFRCSSRDMLDWKSERPDRGSGQHVRFFPLDAARRLPGANPQPSDHHGADAPSVGSL